MHTTRDRQRVGVDGLYDPTALEGSDVHSMRATDSHGNTATGTAFDRDEARDIAIFKVTSQR